MMVQCRCIPFLSPFPCRDGSELVKVAHEAIRPPFHFSLSDARVRGRAGPNFRRMGVTRLVLGNCGSSVLSVGEFFRRLEATNISVNVATLIGHGSVRRK